MEMLMTAKLYTAEESREMGLANWVFPDDQLHDRTMEVAKNICKSSKFAIYQSKTAYYAQAEMTEKQACMYAKEMMALEEVGMQACRMRILKRIKYRGSSRAVF